MLKLFTYSGSILSLALAPAFTTTALAAEDVTADDIKPGLAEKDLDDEQMRLAVITHKRIVDYQKIKKDNNGGKLQPFEPYQDTTKSGVKFEMVPVKSGSFTWNGNADGDSLEVTLSDFWMGKAEVTWEEFEPFMLSEIPRQKDGQVVEFVRDSLESDIDFLARPTPPYHPMTYGMPRDGYPAISMTQHSANKYCQWLSFQTGHFYRLPTEAEWEYACRAGSKTKYPWGDKAEEAEQYAWIGGDAASQYNKPKLKKPNAWGLHDMLGNVQEWTLDQQVPNRREYFGKDKVTNPWIKATKSYPHVTKGGYWTLPLAEVSAGARIPSSPKWKQTDPQEPKSQWYLTDTPWIGLRIVRPAKIPTALEMYHYWNSGVSEDDETAIYHSEHRAESKVHEKKTKQ